MTHHYISAHSDPHYCSRNNWLRAGVLGANDGLISTASLLMGLVAAHANSETVLLTGLAALVGGAISMAAGEYVSVSSQADTEKADLVREERELCNNPKEELVELTSIYRARGLDEQLAKQVAIALTEHDALAAHARDEIGITETLSANPFQAAIASALSFCIGAVLPLLSVIWFTEKDEWALVITTFLGLSILGIASAKLGGAPILPALIRVLLWGIIALASTAFMGHLFGVNIV
ncbi:MAG: VIT family protein [Neisseriaceae bacterium]|nr:VIT family protein [Neisseriaceae bacterium]